MKNATRSSLPMRLRAKDRMVAHQIDNPTGVPADVHEHRWYSGSFHGLDDLLGVRQRELRVECSVHQAGGGIAEGDGMGAGLYQIGRITDHRAGTDAEQGVRLSQHRHAVVGSRVNGF